MHDKGTGAIEDVYFACKGPCDDKLERELGNNKMPQATGSKDFADFGIEESFKSFIDGLKNQRGGISKKALGKIGGLLEYYEAEFPRLPEAYRQQIQAWKDQATGWENE